VIRPETKKPPPLGQNGGGQPPQNFQFLKKENFASFSYLFVCLFFFNFFFYIYFILRGIQSIGIIFDTRPQRMIFRPFYFLSYEQMNINLSSLGFESNSNFYNSDCNNHPNFS